MSTQEGWGVPEYVVVEDALRKGPQQERKFRIKAIIGETEYIPERYSQNKKQAKVYAAIVALDKLGVLY